MSSDALDPSAILSKISSVLPEDKALKGPQDAVAVLCHSVMTILNFRLVGLDDVSSDTRFDQNTLPPEWSKNSPDSFGFRYRHDQSSLVFYLKLVKLSRRLVIHGIALEDDKTTTLDIPVEEFTSPSAFPYTVAADSPSPLVHCFISSARVKDLVGQYKLQILQKLVPGLRKEGYEDETTAQAAPTNASSQNPSSSSNSFSSNRPFIPSASPDEEPFTLPRAPRYPSGSNPLEIGRSDLEPLGGAIPPPFGFSPPPVFPGAGGGMYVGPDHPMFRDRMDPRSGGFGGVGGERRGPWGGDGFLPPMGAPLGARFDPVGPFGPGGPENSPGLGHRLGGNNSNGARNFGPAGGGGAAGPDNDEFMPPGFSDMYS